MRRDGGALEEGVDPADVQQERYHQDLNEGHNTQDDPNLVLAKDHEEQQPVATLQAVAKCADLLIVVLQGIVLALDLRQSLLTDVYRLIRSLQGEVKPFFNIMNVAGVLQQTLSLAIVLSGLF